MLSFCQHVDRLIGDLLDTVSGDVFIVSDHGFESKATRRFHVNEWLRRRRHLSVVGGAAGNRILALGQAVGRRYVQGKTLKRLLNAAPRNGNGPSKPGDAVIDRSKARLPSLDSNSDAVLATDWGIDVNASGDRYERICRDIIDGLGALSDTDGRRVMKTVHHKRDVYDRGAYFDQTPNIVFQIEEDRLAEAQLSTSLFSGLKGMAGRAESGYRFNADHTHDRRGIIMALGPNVGEERDLDAHITDVAPTILHLLGLPIPESMTGNVLQSIIRPDSPAFSREIAYNSFTDRIGAATTTADEQEAMREHLKDMGYL